jgi:hypothetical protein
MLDVSQKSRSLEIILKLIAIFSGAILIAASILSGDTFQSGSSPSQFLQDQLHHLDQLKWLLGVLLILFGVLFSPRRTPSRPIYSGPKDLGNDAYKLYLVEKYGIEKNTVLDQLICQKSLFSNVADALLFAHELETANGRTNPVDSPKVIHHPENLQPNFSSMKSVEVGIKDTSPINPPPHQVESSEAERRRRIIFLLGLVLIALVVGGLYYANTQSVKEEVVVVVSPTPPSNTDQVVANSIPTNPSPPVEQVAAEAATKSSTLPINELWIGTWNAVGNKQKIVITASSFKYGNDDFTWAGVRPKGVIQCCPAFYEGSSSKAELLARIQESAANSALKGDQQKTIDLVNTLSEGNFKKIVLADPFLRKYFFIYDQNTIYRINRDLGDNAELVIEPFRKQE